MARGITFNNTLAVEYAMIASIVLFIAIATTTTTVTADDATPIPADAGQIGEWFEANVQPLASRGATLNSTLAAAEANQTIIKVRQDGSGDYTNLTDAIKNIPTGNSGRVIVDIGPGEYNEKVVIDRSKPFITLYGSPTDMPTLVFGGTAHEFGTVYSATLQIEADFFNAVNIIFKNSAPKPDDKTPGAQAVALRIAGDMAAFYNCKFLGFQDTLCDDRGRHFYKDCYIEGTVDFIFGSGKSIFLNTELHVLADNGIAVITANAKENEAQQTGFSFVHCTVTGVGHGAFLGRAWMPMPEVVFAYSAIGDAIDPAGWSDNDHPERDSTLIFGEYQNTGPGATPSSRAKYTKQMTEAEVKPYLSLSFIEGSSWLLPPPTL